MYFPAVLDLWIVPWFHKETSSDGNSTLNPWNGTCWWRGRLRRSICAGQSAQQVPQQLPPCSQRPALSRGGGRWWRATVDIRGTTPGVSSWLRSSPQMPKMRNWDTLWPWFSHSYTTTYLYVNWRLQFIAIWKTEVRISEIYCILEN